MNTADKLRECQFYCGLWRDIGALVLMVKGFEFQLQELRAREWHIPNASRFENKCRMKSLGGALMLYRETYTELMILGISRAVEVLTTAINETFHISFDIYSSPSTPLRFHRDVKILRHMANVIKHDAGEVSIAGGRSSASLMAEFGIPEETPIGSYWEYADLGVHSDLIVNLYRVESFCCDLIARTTPYSDRFQDIPDTGIRQYMFRKYLSHIPGEEESDGTTEGL